MADADDAAQALPLTVKHKPDLVLMDICAGEDSSGIRAARELRQAYPKLKIALMTGVPEIHFEEKTGYSSIAQLAIYAVSNGLLLPDYYA